jgi:hypothetical protein
MLGQTPGEAPDGSERCDQGDERGWPGMSEHAGRGG